MYPCLLSITDFQSISIESLLRLEADCEKCENLLYSDDDDVLFSKMID